MKNVFLVYFFFCPVSCEEDVDLITFVSRVKIMFSGGLSRRLLLGPNGSLVIEAYTGNEVITLKITSTLGEPTLGNSTEEIALMS
jgi:hypothetical protein